RDEPPAERRGDPAHQPREEPQYRFAATLELGVAPDPGEAQEDVREHGVPARRRVIVEVLLARDEPLAVDRRLEEAAAPVVFEELDREACESMRPLQPAHLARRDVQLVEPVRDVGVVLEVPGPLRDAVPPRAVEPSLGCRERPEQELAEPPAGVEPVVALEQARTLGGPPEPQARPRRPRPVGPSGPPGP